MEVVEYDAWGVVSHGRLCFDGGVAMLFGSIEDAENEARVIRKYTGDESATTVRVSVCVKKEV